jgi:hypothetical protein
MKELIFNMKKYLYKKEYIFYLSVIALIVLSIGIVLRNNIYHGELDIYLPHYLSNLPLGKIIFDPICELDLTRKYFRGRELGNLFNYIDYNAIPTLFKLKLPAFISIINYFSLIFIVILSVNITNKNNPKALNSTYLSLILFLSSPAILFSGTLYRTNKVVASLGIFLTILFITKSFLEKESNSRFKNYILFFYTYISCILACGSDEQGFIFSLLIFLILIYINIFYGKKLLTELYIITLSLLTYFLYIKILGPWLFESINGIIPLTIPVDQSEILNKSNFINSVRLLIRYFILLFGNIRYFGELTNTIYVFITILFTYLLIRKLSKTNITKLIVLLLFSILYIAFVLNIMTLKHPAIYWEDIFTYYSLPIITLLFSVFLLFINYAIKNNKVNIIFLNIILTILIILNFTSLSYYKNIFRNGHLKHFRSANQVVKAVEAEVDQSSRILKSLRIEGEVSGARSDMNYSEQGTIALRNKIINKN